MNRLTVEDFEPENGTVPVAFKNSQGLVFPYTAALNEQQRKMRLTPLYQMPSELIPVEDEVVEDEVTAAVKAEYESPVNPLQELGKKALSRNNSPTRRQKSSVLAGE